MEPSTSAVPPGITEPVPRALAALLRRAVLDHATGERRRAFPPRLHVGRPGQHATSLELGANDLSLDQSLRTDVLEAMVRRVQRPGPPPLVWLTRRAPLDVQDGDLGWSSAAVSASGELDVALLMVVVVRHGWSDPRTGVGQVWQRLRCR